MNITRISVYQVDVPIKPATISHSVSAVPEMLVDGRNEGAALLKVSSSASY